MTVFLSFRDQGSIVSGEEFRRKSLATRTALLIGNSVFNDASLARLAAPENDVIALKSVLERPDIADFDCTLLINAGLDEVRNAVAHLFHNRSPDDLVLFYYTGHGLRDDRGDLYLALPMTNVAAPGAVSLDADYLRKQMNHSYARRQVLILDCCHSGAFMGPGAKRAGSEQALHATDFDPGGHGRFVLAASAANESAFEVDGRSVFTRHLVDALENGEAAPEREEVTITDLHAYVVRRVISDRAAMQPRLWVDEQTEPVVIARNPKPRKPLPPQLVEALYDEDPMRALGAATQLIAILKGPDAQLASDAERVLRQRLAKPESLTVLVADPIRAALEETDLDPEPEPAPIRQSGQVKQVSRRPPRSEELRKSATRALGFANGAVASSGLATFAMVKRRPRLIAGLASAGILVLVAASTDFGQLLGSRTANRFTDCPACPAMLVVPAGTFMMGSPVGEEGRKPNEGPQREVSVAPFALAETELTFDQWDACAADGGCRSNPEPDDKGWGRGTRPVINVSWDGAQEYLAWLNSKVDGDPYRLPSEAEWEYAARAGTTTPFWTGTEISTDQANFHGDIEKLETRRGMTLEVGSLEAENPWGFRHMSGNVQELVEDCWYTDYSGAPETAVARTGPGGNCALRAGRGGSWASSAASARAAARTNFGRSSSYAGVGFRPAKTLTQ